MPRRLLVLFLALPLAAGCGSGGTTRTGTTLPTTSVPVSPPPMTLTVFRISGGPLHAELVRVPRTRAVAAAALGALDLAAGVTVSGGTAHVALDHVTPAQQAEIVYTLTQFPSIHRVDVGGKTGLTRRDVAAYLPPILVESPVDGQVVGSTFIVKGTASVFEATLVVELVRRGVLQRKTLTASEGAPGRGSFETTLHATGAGATALVAFAPNAAGGPPQHVQRVHVVVAP
jgi:hypothetical protein